MIKKPSLSPMREESCSPAEPASPGAGDRPRTPGPARRRCVPGRGRRSRGARRCSFFLQAEAGIRDVAVTGVQTCALPIYIHDEIKDLGSHVDNSLVDAGIL